ncbi:TIGR03086 family metal-binding protein [Gordonia liuliyuniae]|uniref:TIGR03086 family metal-binding protein n=1 Tax=Gordonia liuliyuniae TaxID=2911517 RepID=A0ABS9IXX9_9ACTN|nr:TIGR03086 family metal-binding protein [Gordonia liuliyuniae]MCF8590437.1 TIGR03086 family metal-binding protein [Gordonia liuliyuniae]
MDTSAALIRALDQLADLLDQAADIPSTAPTPCTEFDVAALRGHIVGWLTAFTDGFTADDHTCSDPDAVTVSGSGAAQVRAAADRLRTVLPAALAEPLKIGDAGMPGDMAASMILWEYQMHGWDLAQAAGLDWSPDDEAVEASLAVAPAMLTPDFQGEGKAFAAAVPVAESATPLERLVGLSGRRPMR